MILARNICAERIGLLKGCKISMETETHFTIELNKCCKNVLLFSYSNLNAFIYIVWIVHLKSINAIRDFI